MDKVRIPYRDITSPGVTFRQESVLSIDPGRKRVVTNAGGYDADVLVVALGADLAPEATPGLDECGHEFYSPDGAARVRELLPAFPGGNVVTAVLGGFFKCPPAPYETAPLRRLSPRSLVRSRIRRKPARWHDPRFSVTT